MWSRYGPKRYSTPDRGLSPTVNPNADLLYQVSEQPLAAAADALGSDVAVDIHDEGTKAESVKREVSELKEARREFFDRVRILY